MQGAMASNDGAIRQMRDKTQTEYFETMINTLRLELKKEISAIQNKASSQNNLNSSDMLVNKLAQKLDTIEKDFKKLDRQVNQSVSMIKLEIEGQPEKQGSYNYPVGDNNNNGDAMQRITHLERGLQTFEKQIAEQLEAALNDLIDRLGAVVSDQDELRERVNAAHAMVGKLDSPFRDMKEVLIQITEALSEVENGTNS